MSNPDKIQSKIISSEDLLSRLSQNRLAGKTIVFTNGCFDILHKGHIQYLYDASAFGDFLIVGLNSDASVSRLKGDRRPVQDEESRSSVLASLFFVDYIVLFEEDTPIKLISHIKPDVLIKGGDYRAEEIVGYDVVSNSGGKVIILPFLEGYSTSTIIDKLKNLH